MVQSPATNSLLICYGCRSAIAAPTVCPTCVRPSCRTCLRVGGCVVCDRDRERVIPVTIMRRDEYREWMRAVILAREMFEESESVRLADGEGEA